MMKCHMTSQLFVEGMDNTKKTSTSNRSRKREVTFEQDSDMLTAPRLLSLRASVMRESRRGMAWFGQNIGDMSPKEMAARLHSSLERPKMPTPLTPRARQYYWRPASFPAFAAKPPRGSKQRALTNHAGAQGLYKPSPWL